LSNQQALPITKGAAGRMPERTSHNKKLNLTGRHMVKVREDQPLNPDGTVNIPHWLQRLQEDVKLQHPERVLAACELAREAQRNARAEDNIWIAKGSRSFRTGLEMADILGELQMDEDSLIAAILYRSAREEHIRIGLVEEEVGDTVFKLIKGGIADGRH